MRYRTWSAKILGTVAAVAVLAGCEPAPERTGDEVAELDQATVDSLKVAHPRLLEEPLPPPQPNGPADSNELPESLTTLPESVLERVTGQATFYADHFEGRRTASGIPFRQNQMVAAHRAYPFGTILRVTNLANERQVNVKVVDRGPFGNTAAAQRTIIDLSRRAAQQLGYIEAGRTPVRVEVLEWGSGIAT